MSMLSNRVALVTGASAGIGRAIALAFAAEGAAVVLNARGEAALAEVVEAVRAAGGQAIGVVGDVAAPETHEALVAAAQRAFGGLDIAINNAGAVETGPLARFDQAAWDRMLAVNLTGTFLCTRAALPPMLAAGAGRIVNIASSAGQKGYAYCTAYAAAKHGVVGLTRSLALEVATRGLSVNAVCPGYTDTDIVRAGVARIVAATGRSEAEAGATFAQASPMQRLVRPEEVAATVRWLCTDAPAAITGQALAVSGGEVMP